jgi:hypothetical protein
VLALDHRAAGHDDVVALAVELDELELELLAFQVHRVADRAHVDQRARQERADVLDVDGEAALDLAADAAGDGLVLLEASSSSSHTIARLAFSRDSTVSPKPFSSESSATLTSSPTATSISPASLRNCSIGTMPSDFRPALITTTSLRTSTTMPLTIAAGLELGQLAWLCSNSSAKDSVATEFMKNLGWIHRPPARRDGAAHLGVGVRAGRAGPCVDGWMEAAGTRYAHGTEPAA